VAQRYLISRLPFRCRGVRVDPTKFLHFFIFEDKAAHAAHASSNAVKRFEAAYRPELLGGDVVFTDYELVAAKS
jgi:quinol monooxygenase YgiN